MAAASATSGHRAGVQPAPDEHLLGGIEDWSEREWTIERTRAQARSVGQAGERSN
jgi:hypothetical protein